MSDEDFPFGFQFASEFAKVVDLTVVDHNNVAIVGGHRLVTCVGRVHNGKSNERQCDITILGLPQTDIVRTPAPECCAGHVNSRSSVGTKGDHTSNTAHGLVNSP